MTSPPYQLKRTVVILVALSAAFCAAAQVVIAVVGLVAGHPDAFLRIPLGVALPFFAFVFLARMSPTRSSEGALMRLAAMVLILLILMLPDMALLMALGFPVAFLCVEIFETEMPRSFRDRLKARVIE